MSSTVSRSAKHDDHVPSRRERDQSYSSGAGRKAIEEPKPDRYRVENEPARKTIIAAPIGLDNETMNIAPIGLDNETRAGR